MDAVSDPEQLHDLLKNCDNEESLLRTIIDTLIIKPNLFDDEARLIVSDCYKERLKSKAKNLITLGILNKLLTSKTQTLTWIKYECLLCYLIKSKVYEPKILMDEVLAIAKNETVSQEVGSKFASCLSGCVECCRGVCSQEEQEEQKWCEIIDWMSWFLGSTNEDFY